MIVDELHRRSQRPYPQEQRRKAYRHDRRPAVFSRSTEEHFRDRRCEYLEEQDAYSRNYQAIQPCSPDSLLHPRVIARGVVVSDYRHHPLADPDIHRVRDTLHLQDYAHAREHKVAVRRREYVDADARQIEQPRQQSGRDPDRQNIFDISSAYAAGVCPAHAERRGLLRLPVSGQQEDQPRRIGNECSHRGAGDFIPVRHDHEHEYRIQHHIQDAASTETYARLRRKTCVPQKVGKRQARDSHRTSEHDDKKRILFRIDNSYF